MTWRVKPAASLADHATIELRRITEVLQVDHASLFLRDPDDPQRAVAVAETGTPVAEALSEHATIVGRVLQTGRVQEVHLASGAGESTCAALATPLQHEGQAVGALLVVTLRKNRRLGAIDAQLIGRATETLVERILPWSGEAPDGAASKRFTRDTPSARRLRARS
jgi:GAF domain